MLLLGSERLSAQGIIEETATLQLAQRNQYPTDIADPFSADVLKQRFVPVAQKRSGRLDPEESVPCLVCHNVPGA